VRNIIIMRCAFILFILWVTVVPVHAYGTENIADEKLRLDKEIENLQTTYAVWQSNDAEFRKMREQGQASKIDIREFAAFVAGLKRQVIEGCETVRKLGGDASLHGVDCVKLEDDPESKKGGAVNITKRELTREEKKALLEQQMGKLISDFDGLLLQHQEKLKWEQGVSQSNGSQDSGAFDKSGAKETAGAGVPADEVEKKPGSKDGPIQRAAEPGSGPGVEKQGEMPDFKKGDVWDSSDDDVIARQLREAAETETDPLLKKQLWEEYKKYKKSTR
jgi:hypothetical protein